MEFKIIKMIKKPYSAPYQVGANRGLGGGGHGGNGRGGVCGYTGGNGGNTPGGGGGSYNTNCDGQIFLAKNRNGECIMEFISPKKFLAYSE